MSSGELKSTNILQELVTNNPDVMVVPLSVDEARLVRTSFMRIADKMEEIGTASFSELFTHHPEAIRIFVSNRVFPESISEVQYSWELKSHALRVMHTFEKIINRLDKPSTVWSAMISDIGCRHAAYNAKPAYLPVLVAAFRHAFFKEFSQQGILTPELSSVWYKLFNNMTVLMTAAVVASFVDSYAEYKRNPSVIPVWIAGPENHPNLAHVTSSSSLASKNCPSDAKPNKCPVAHQQSAAAAAPDHNHQHHRSNEAQSQLSQLSVDSPPKRSNSSKIKQRFSEFLSLPTKSASTSTSKSGNKGDSMSHSSSGEDVQIIHI